MPAKGVEDSGINTEKKDRTLNTTPGHTRCIICCERLVPYNTESALQQPPPICHVCKIIGESYIDLKVHQLNPAALAQVYLSMSKRHQHDFRLATRLRIGHPREAMEAIERQKKE